jgi:HTH-type transcriptional regulator/antitoxin HigA
LDGLIDEVGEDESHPLAPLMEIIGVLIEKYEDEHVPELPVQ